MNYEVFSSNSPNSPIYLKTSKNYPFLTAITKKYKWKTSSNQLPNQIINPNYLPIIANKKLKLPQESTDKFHQSRKLI